MNRVRDGRVYLYHANLLDIVDARTSLQTGDEVRVVKLPGCPKAGTMSHCHVADPETGAFVGLVHVNSLHTREAYIDYLKWRIADLEAGR